MNQLLTYLSSLKKMEAFNEVLNKPKQSIVLNNLNDNLASLLLADAFSGVNSNLLVIAPNLFKAQKYYDKLVQVLGDEYVYFFPMDEFISAEMLASSDEFRQERLNTLVNLLQKQKGIVVTHTIGAIRKLPNQQVYQKSILRLMPGTIIDYNDLITHAVEIGYHRVDVVEGPGEMAVRGGIVDIYPYTTAHPYRIEFFDDEVDSIRLFDEKSQRTIERVDEALLTPIYELVYSDEVMNKAISKLRIEFDQKIESKKGIVRQELESRFTQELLDIENHNELIRLHKYIDYFYEETSTIVDYMDNPYIFYVEYHNVENSYDNFVMEYNQFNTELLESNRTLFLTKHYISIHQLMDKKMNQIFLQEYSSHLKDIKFTESIDFSSRSIEQYFGKIEDFYKEVQRNRDHKTYCICFENRSSRSHFSEVLTEQGIPHAMIGEQDSLVKNHVNLIVSQLEEGFEIIDEGLKVITPFELFKKQTRQVKYRSTKIKDAIKIKDVDDLKVGDYIVHLDHGFGQYLGIETLDTNGVHKDFLQIAYQGGDKLYVPVDNINLVQKFVGNEGTVPKLHKIGGTQWKKTKQKVSSQVKDIAAKLIKLYAERENAVGYAYSTDTPMQKQFEEEFEFVETPDQLQAVREIKTDMERTVPMDRLLCGDVGYGKTEVAMRAAFKAVMDGKQVAYLAPTTILTQQHYENFIRRFQNFPINIALLNRFVTPKQQKEVLERLKKGQVDIVIGTHRLLSKDVIFNDLGLLIVDEEQRFGVEHKERIKELKVNVDVLTLTATPIPRTLQMSLIGVRSLSLLETPPANRYPVQTYVIEENDTIIKEAIERELARKGQVFYLHNRVEDIDIRAQKIGRLIPEARVTYAHGQMSKDELENTMFQFLNKEFDVLVCTTIIETGIDIANANTLIIANSDKLGLAQLYQLRGRVGRSDRIAYAYMMFAKRKVLTEVATKRLTAIKEFTELGSGFKIAKQDLAIRGAGDLLGAQQYGFIDTVGFELYTQMLREAIDESKGDLDLKKEVLNDEENAVEIRILQDAYIPTHYIEDESLKIEVYKKIKLINSYDDLLELQSELIDRFSDFPEPVSNLLNLAFIKSACLDLGIKKMVETKTNVEFQYSLEGSEKVNGEFYFMIANDLSPNINFRYLHKQFLIMIDKPRLKDNYLDLMTRFFVKIIQSRNV